MTRLTRRRFLQNTFAFSAAASLVGCGSGIHSAGLEDPVVGGALHLLMVGDWGTEKPIPYQSLVAASMQNYVAKWKISTDALLMLGDNFYGQMPDGVSSSRWQTQFEQMYPQSSFDCPAYAVPGNHDYQLAPSSKFEAELAYAKIGTSRWKMPARYFRITLPAQNPLITLIALDSNMPNEPAQPMPPDPTYYTPTDLERVLQLEWLASSLQEPKTTPFHIVMGHHPLYSNGAHGDNQTLIRDWDPLFRKYGVHLYLAGHDHDLQHLEFTGHPTSFVVSGGGGADLATLNSADAERGPYAQLVHGFSHLQIQPDLMTLRHLDISGGLLHKFTNTPDGVLTIVK